MLTGFDPIHRETPDVSFPPKEEFGRDDLLLIEKHADDLISIDWAQPHRHPA